ncbi:MAG TPA: tetratricopeptide repeat protein [Phycisphaerae bacterium]|nr:tetratricopeptide repeat protein [Phycisphaerae bacterium]HNU45373.1 tetratricopeptide repeat protein [Phycisphaerae bacterium]
MEHQEPTRTAARPNGGSDPKDGLRARRRYLLLAGGLIAVALGARILLLVDYLHRHPIALAPQNDARVYWEQAERIADGRWVGDEPFLSVPLYPYLLGVIRLWGGGLRAVYGVQIALHLLTAALLAYLAARKLGRSAGIVALIVFLLLEEPAFFTLRVMPSTVQLLLVALLLLAADHVAQEARRGRAALLGLLAGLLTLVYPPALLLVLLLPLWCRRQALRQERSRARAAAPPTAAALPHGSALPIGSAPPAASAPPTGTASPAASALPAGSAGQNPSPPWGRGQGEGVAGDDSTLPRPLPGREGGHGSSSKGLLYGLITLGAGLAPVLLATLHNYLACGELIPITAHAGITFNQGNAPGADGGYTPIEGVSNLRGRMHADAARVYAQATGHAGSYRRIDRFFFDRGVDYLASDWRRAAWLTCRKAYWCLTGRNYYDYDHLTWERRDGLLPWLGLTPIPTAWLFGPAVAGLLLTCRRRVFNLMDVASLVLPLVIVAAFWYSPRYRLPVIPLLTVAVAAAAIRAAQACASYQATPESGASHAGAGRQAWAVGLVLALTVAGPAGGPVNRALGFDLLEDYRVWHEQNIGKVYQQVGQYEEALARFTQASMLAPQRADVRAAVVETLVQLRRFDEADVVCAQFVELFPEAPEAWRSLGKLEVARRNWASAETAFRQAVTLDPTSAPAHLGLWLALSNQGRANEGEPHLTQAVTLDPDNPIASGDYAIRQAEQGRLDAALDWLTRTVRNAPGLPQAHYNLGLILRRLGRGDDAAACFEQALYLDPNYTKAQQELNRLQELLRGPYRRAVALNHLIAQDPRPADRYSELAGILYALGDVPAAVAVLRQAVQNANNDGTARLELAWLLATTADDTVRDGAAAWRLVDVLANQPSPSPQTLDVQAAALAATGEWEQAAAVARQAATRAEQDGLQDLALLIRERAEHYRTRQPYREPVPQAPPHP